MGSVATPVRYLLRLGVVPIALAAGSNAADSAVVTANLGVSITIQAACEIVALSDLDFGTQGIISAAVAVTTTLDVQCTDTTTFNVGLDAGGGTGATVAARLLGDTIAYGLYSDSAHGNVWGETIGTDTVSGTGDGTPQTFTIYGLVPAQATPVPGTYTDTVVVTVTY
jgi:spore coat protein U-like protein